MEYADAFDDYTSEPEATPVTLESIIFELNSLTVYNLADMADCYVPDSLDSPGALLLKDTRDTFTANLTAEWLDRFHDGGSDMIAEIADQAPSVYAHARWQEFVDLGAYNEIIDAPTDLTDAAGIALYAIADRLCYALLDETRRLSEGN